MPSALSPGKPRVYHEPKLVKLTQASRAEALATAANFVKTAVARRNVEQSWLLVSPALNFLMSALYVKALRQPAALE